MSKINILDKHTAELIAAGEVVERPSSVVKELVENSIDSGAAAVTVEIKNGGRTFIRVTDDGCGIEKDDIKKAFFRHATSKIAVSEDLDSINSLGFRGEALASISAVSRVELITKTRGSEFGYRYTLEGGQELEFDETGAPDGTTFIIKDLFFNTPARMKFMKKDVTESGAIISICERLALSRPEISFSIIKDGKQVIKTPGDGDLKSAVFAVFGKEFSSGLVPVGYEHSGVRIGGFVTKPTAARKNKQMQFFYLNRRFIRSKTAFAALEQAYKHKLLTGFFPACVLNIEIDPGFTDVNVHPSKIEVRFSDEQKVFSAVYYAVKSAVDRQGAPLAQSVESEDLQQIADTKTGSKVSLDAPPQIGVIESKPLDVNLFSKPTLNLDLSNIDVENDEQPNALAEPVAVYNSVVNVELLQQKNAEKTQKNQKNQEKKPENQAEECEKINIKYIGQAFEVYIIVQAESCLYLIDKHAAHERILFEEIKNTAKHSPQMLLVPKRVNLSANEYSAILTHTDKLKNLGFELEDYGQGEVLVRAVPMELNAQDVDGLITEIAGRLCENFTDITPDFLDWIYHSVACRAAIKAGDKSSPQELLALARRVLGDAKIRYCPHGRPVVVQMSEQELKKRFSRIV